MTYITNSTIRWAKKMASYLHRTATTIYPCCIPALGEFNRSWSYKTCRCKIEEKGNGAGGFTLSSLVSACNGSTVYHDAMINVASTDKITVTTKTATNSELVQAWERVK
jgi:hypothetical protein